ncbi:DNA mismatch endonuclease Vsr [Leclercia adecarboxylata]|uniref:very short patch repair endonuclease n=1 Tax=Leclercia adecarboxylata TaxID=83655 RepID=UPI00194F15D3|nr:very short patch repair endonuclease [Leclercia adecarboxylata]MBM6634446.1 DNA mismatch endonuclease Vsr [Leclercia adecarboxylata]
MPNMKLFKSKDTKIELKIRKPLFARGLRYRLYNADLPGKPDMYFPKYNAVIFIHGCFWHGHDNCCPISHIPKNNQSYWRNKIGKNKERDMRNQKNIASKNIRVLIIWECAIKRKNIDFIDFIDYIEQWLKGGAKSTQMSAREPMPIFEFEI